LPLSFSLKLGSRCPNRLFDVRHYLYDNSEGDSITTLFRDAFHASRRATVGVLWELVSARRLPQVQRLGTIPLVDHGCSPAGVRVRVLHGRLHVLVSHKIRDLDHIQAPQRACRSRRCGEHNANADRTTWMRRSRQSGQVTSDLDTGTAHLSDKTVLRAYGSVHDFPTSRFRMTDHSELRRAQI
jgi:hypothetical protein